MGGASGADTVCNSNKPAGFGGSTFKAMLTDSGSRAACTSGGAGDCSATGSTTGRMDWVFAPNDTLCTSDYLKRVGTTNANGYPQIPTANILASSNTVVFTGMDIYMGVAGSNNCSNWGATSGSATAGYANGVSGDHGFWANNGGIFPACSAAAKIYCVEQ